MHTIVLIMMQWLTFLVYGILNKKFVVKYGLVQAYVHCQQVVKKGVFQVSKFRETISENLVQTLKR